MSRKPCINREDKRNIPQFSYTVIFVTRTMKFLAVVTPQSIYHKSINRKLIHWNFNIILEGLRLSRRD